MSTANARWRQKLHLEPPQGWMNDPNGLCFYKGSYHVYFQYSPMGARGEPPRGWGHFTSPDLLHWTFTGMVLQPDIPEDRNGAYSGSAIERGGLLHLFYTGNVKEQGDYDYILRGRGANVIRVTTADGSNMSSKEVLLRNSDYPAFCSCHVRDPKVWEEDGVFRIILGARTVDGRGCALLYTSDDLTHWQYDRCLSLPDTGYMWECPDLFTLGDTAYLSASPQGVPAETYRFQNVYSCGYFRMDGDTPTQYTEWDCGFDFYAPQTFLAPDGRRLLIGWMGIGDIPYTNPTVPLGWQHCLTLPREVTQNTDGLLLQTPARELDALRKDALPLQNGTYGLPFDLCGKADGDFRLSLDGVQMQYADGVFTLRFTDDAIGCGRTVRYAKLPQCRLIRVIADTSSLEIYLDGGRTALSTRWYPAASQTALCAENLTGSLYPLRGMQIVY